MDNSNCISSGVMGGDFSEVKEQTSNIVIEGAIFDPV